MTAKEHAFYAIAIISSIVISVAISVVIERELVSEKKVSMRYNTMEMSCPANEALMLINSKWYCFPPTPEEYHWELLKNKEDK